MPHFIGCFLVKCNKINFSIGPVSVGWSLVTNTGRFCSFYPFLITTFSLQRLIWAHLKNSPHRFSHSAVRKTPQSLRLKWATLCQIELHYVPVNKYQHSTTVIKKVLVLWSRNTGGCLLPSSSILQLWTWLQSWGRCLGLIFSFLNSMLLKGILLMWNMDISEV